MAAPVATYIQTPSDAGNTGKKVRTQSRVVGSDTVHEHFFIPVDPRDVLSIYFMHSGVISVPTSADNATSTGRFWAFNPVGSGIKVAVRSARMSYQFVAAALDLSAARFALALFTATGTASGATITPAKRDSTDATPVGTIRTAVTGLTVTLGAILRADLLTVMALATGTGVPAGPFLSAERDLNYEEHIIIRAGEGIVGYCPDASTTANRRATCDMILEDFS